MKLQAWYGTFYDSYFNRLENGEWINVGLLKYIYLKLNGFRTRVSWK